MQRLLGGIEAGKISASAIGAPEQDKLLSHSPEAIRERAAKLFAAVAADRQVVLKRFESVNDLPGDAARGLTYFRQNCTPCHRLHDEGNAVGPDLGSVAFKPVGYLMLSILDPNQSVEARYTGSIAVAKNEQEYTGIITAETPNSITLRMAGGTDVVILRSDLKELNNTGRSLMPDGFENSLNPQALSDLIAFIRSNPSPGPH